MDRPGRTANLVVWPTTAWFSIPFCSCSLTAVTTDTEDPPTVISPVRESIGRLVESAMYVAPLIIEPEPVSSWPTMPKVPLTIPDAGHPETGVDFSANGAAIPADVGKVPLKGEVAARGPGLEGIGSPCAHQRGLKQRFEGHGAELKSDVAVALTHAVTEVHQLAVGTDGVGLKVSFPAPGSGWSG